MQDSTRVVENTQKLPIKEINFLYDDGILLFCAGKYEESIKCFDKIISLNPNSRIVFGYKGLALIKLNRRKEARECYVKALAC